MSRKVKSVGLLAGMIVISIVFVVIGMLTLFKWLSLESFKIVLYSYMITLPSLALVYNLASYRGVAERSKYERIVAIFICVSVLLALLTIGLVWYFIA